MAKTPGQRGEFGRWLERVRSARYETQAKALADMDRLAGLRIAPSEYAQWESGSRVPRADNPKVQRLYDFFGGRPEPEPEPQTDQGALIAALAAQTEAITALTTEIRVAALAVLGGQEGTAELLGQLVVAAREGTLDELVSGLRGGDGH